MSDGIMCTVHHDRLARYRWTFRRTGGVINLCVQCCAAWRQADFEDPGWITPSRIMEIEGGATRLTWLDTVPVDNS